MKLLLISRPPADIRSDNASSLDSFGIINGVGVGDCQGFENNVKSRRLPGKCWFSQSSRPCESASVNFCVVPHSYSLAVRPDARNAAGRPGCGCPKSN